MHLSSIYQESEADMRKGEKMPDPFTFAVIITLLTKNAPSWLDALRGTLLDKGKEVAIEKGKDYAVEKGTGLIRGFLRLDEKEQ